MNSGELTHRVTIQETSATIGARGAVAPGWITLETVYMSVESLSGTEQSRFSQDVSENVVRFGMRYREDLGSSDVKMHPKYRLSYNSRFFEVISVRDMQEEHRWTEIMAKEVTDRVT